MVVECQGGGAEIETSFFATCLIGTNRLATNGWIMPLNVNLDHVVCYVGIPCGFLSSPLCG